MFGSPDTFTAKKKPDTVLSKVKAELLRRGAHGIRGLGIVFRRMDDNRDRHLDKYEFQWGLRENGHELSPKEMDELFDFFDENKDGRVSYNEFLKAIRGDMNERRLNLVRQAHAKLDKNGDGTVNIMDMKLAYDVSQHPDFK
jgi:Ca2+-binding EF-hand superfamily protein